MSETELVKQGIYREPDNSHLEWPTPTCVNKKCCLQPVYPRGNQSWIFIGETDAEAETLILWPPDAENWLIWKHPDAGNDWRQEEEGTTEDEMVGWHHWLNGHEFESAPGVGDGQGSLVCCSPWGCKELDMTEQLNWTEPTSPRTGSLTQGLQSLTVPWAVIAPRKSPNKTVAHHFHVVCFYFSWLCFLPWGRSVHLGVEWLDHAVCACVLTLLNHFSHVQPFVTPWTVA